MEKVSNAFLDKVDPTNSEDTASQLTAKVYSVPGFADHRKRFASTFSIYVIKRLLEALSERGRCNRTQLATRTGLNYNKCVRYLNLLELLRWVEFVFDKEYCVSITEFGRQTFELISSI